MGNEQSGPRSGGARNLQRLRSEIDFDTGGIGDRRSQDDITMKKVVRKKKARDSWRTNFGNDQKGGAPEDLPNVRHAGATPRFASAALQTAGSKSTQAAAAEQVLREDAKAEAAADLIDLDLARRGSELFKRASGGTASNSSPAARSLALAAPPPASHRAPRQGNLLDG